MSSLDEQNINQVEDNLLWGDEDLESEALIEAMALAQGIDPEQVKAIDEGEMAKLNRYLHSLRKVLETREGKIVLRHWVDAAKAFDQIFVSNSNVYKNAALNDYANERLQEVALAGPKFFTDFINQGFRNAAFEKKLEKNLKQGR